ncbi:hypothetical protein IFM89_016970 [Coptis chinensis]|uniref:Uncharacterized protein n=1 Tax=Coptis chinensis TaxID=261450 RepID=A0A835LRF9_9MAGN|nr:hypothetical protein IFM89_016970 [Coptis chinensis]
MRWQTSLELKPGFATGGCRVGIDRLLTRYAKLIATHVAIKADPLSTRCAIWSFSVYILMNWWSMSHALAMAVQWGMWGSERFPLRFLGPTSRSTTCIAIVRTNVLLLQIFGDYHCVISRKGEFFWWEVGMQQILHIHRPGIYVCWGCLGDSKGSVKGHGRKEVLCRFNRVKVRVLLHFNGLLGFKELL